MGLEKVFICKKGIVVEWLSGEYLIIAAFFDAVRQEKPDRSGLVDNRITIFYISPKSLQVVKPGSASVE